MSRQVTLDGEIIQTTMWAVLVRLTNNEEHWIPRRVLLNGADLDYGDTELECAAWFAEKEEII